MFTILNPHISDFYSMPLAFKYVKRRALKKYGYIFDEAKANNEKVSILINGAASGLIPDKLFGLVPAFLRKFWLKYEIKQWIKLNGFEGLVDVHYSTDSIANKHTLFFLCYKNFKQSAALQKAAASFKHAVAHLSHYYLHAKEYSEAVKNIPNVVLACDADVTHNKYFKHFFPWYSKPMLIVPFAVYDRFKQTTPLAQRLPKAVATGTFHMIELDGADTQFANLKNFANATSAHPLRRNIYEQKESLTNYIDCYCYPYFEQNVNANKGFWAKLKPKKLRVSQSSYFSFNIVDKYNEYQFVIVGEEYYNGLPGVGAFEAMACGTILLGNKECYEGLQMQNEVHFITHDNDLQTIKQLIDTYKAQPAVLEQISSHAKSYVAENFAPAILYKRLKQQTETLQ
jgi:hypothetical protein